MGKIGVFDSGIGGVSVLREIVKILPNATYIYLSDSLHNPYGDQSKEKILEIVIHNVKFLIEKGCSIIVIACNTATAVAIDELRILFPDICFVGTEPAIKVVHDLKSEGKTLLLATKLTLECERIQGLVEKYAPSQLISFPCVGLVELIENKEFEQIEKYFETHFNHFKDVSYVVLGCTHYPLVKDLFIKYFKEAQIIDGGVGIAKQVMRKYVELGGCNEESHLEFIDTSNRFEFKQKIFEYYYNM